MVPTEPSRELASVVHPPIVVLASVVQPSVSDDGKVALVGGEGSGSLGGGLAGEAVREERRVRIFKEATDCLLLALEGEGGIRFT